MPGRGELTAGAWAVIELLLPVNGKRGKQWGDHRKVIDGILWRLRTGAPWRDIPGFRVFARPLRERASHVRYGLWQTCYDRYIRWRRDGTWEGLLAHVQTRSDAAGEVDWEVSVDGTVARAHQHAAGARRKSAKADEKGGSRTQRMRGSGAAGAG